MFRDRACCTLLAAFDLIAVSLHSWVTRKRDEGTLNYSYFVLILDIAWLRRLHAHHTGC